MKKLIILILVTVFVSSCMLTGVSGSKNVTSESRTIDERFTGVKVSQGIKVKLTQDKEVSFTAEMDDNLHEILITEVEDNVLRIYFKDNVSNRKMSTVHLTMPIVNLIKASSGSKIVSVNTLIVNELEIASSSGSEVTIHVEAKSINSESSSGSEINLQGKSDELFADSSSGSQIDAVKLIAIKVNAEASSGADVEVYATASINAKASSGGTIECDGNPKERIIKKSSGGHVDVD